MAHPLFTPEVRLMLEKNDTAGLEAFCESLHPATVAESLADDFSTEDIWHVLQSTDIAKQAAIFVYFPLEWQVKLVEGVGRQQMARLVEQMSHDDRADLLRQLDPQVVESLLRLVDEADRRDIATLVKYPENSAGAIMTTDYAWLPVNLSVEVALDRLRLQAPDRETIYYIYIVDDQRRLLGVVSLRGLILASRRAVLGDLMDAHPLTVRVTDDRETVAQIMTQYDLLALPVVDAEDRLVGIVTYDDIMDVVVSEATEDAHRMGAVAPMTENYLQASFLVIWRKRASWLALLFLAELFTFTALAHFEDAIAEVVVLSLFVPLCISTGGNSGSQAATLITRAMALGQVRLRDWVRVFRHELVMGLVLGMTLGAIGFVRAALTPESVRATSPKRQEAFTVRLPAGSGLIVQPDGIELPPNTEQVIRDERPVVVVLPEGTSLNSTPDKDMVTFSFPPRCTLRQPPVARQSLGLVIALAVCGICLWGTLVGAMLPLIFNRLGFDPGIASSPFVATAVDVTGIVIYFFIARLVFGL
jgi:magnesium transporter